MATLSLCMIVKDEEQVIDRLLKSVEGLFDEIIIVDTGSTDNTKKILSNYDLKVYDYQWEDDFASARNYSFSKASKDYIMWLDADDIIEEEVKNKLIEFKKELSLYDVVMLPYQCGFDIDNNPILTFYRERIVRKDKNFLWTGQIHETINYSSDNVIKIPYAITHHPLKEKDPQRNLKIFETIIKKRRLNAREQFYYGRELMYNKLYHKAIKVLTRFIENEQGRVENKVNASLDLAYCYSQIKHSTSALNALLHSFTFTTPRAEVCNAIGEHFFIKNEYELAKYWYHLALKDEVNMESGGFINPDNYQFIPYLQLSVIYYYLGENKLSLYYHNLAKKIKPNNEIIIYNQQFIKEED